MKPKYVTVKKISIFENALLYSAHHSVGIDVDFRIKLEKVEDLKERFKTAFSNAFVNPTINITVVA